MRVRFFPSRTPRPEHVIGRWSRRQFLRTGALAMAGAPFLSVPYKSLAQTNSLSASAQLNHACIGVGGMGWNDLQNFSQHKQVRIAALCDVDSNHLNKAAQQFPDARKYSDWRELLEKEGSKIDSINVAVPDHMHFIIAFNAIEKGKHVYCQKPLCHDVAEVRALTEAAIRKGVRTQLGTQMAATIHDRTTVLWLREGKIGAVKHAYLCSNRPGAVKDYRLEGPRPVRGEEPPSSLNWDLWLGTAPARPFAPGIYHPVKWRAWLDFGTGWSGDIGCHIFDAMWKGLEMVPPVNVSADVQESWKNSSVRRADNWPQANHITWTFPGNAKTDRKDWTVEWFDGEFYPPEPIRTLYSADLKEYPAESAMIVGSEGALLYSLGYPPQLLPEEKFKNVKRPDLPPRNHYHHFVDAILGTQHNESHFAQTGPMTEAILLGTVAIRLFGQKLRWNSARMNFSQNKEADQLLRRTYRDGWHAVRF